MTFILEYLQFLKNSIYNESLSKEILSVLDTLQLIFERNLLDAFPTVDNSLTYLNGITNNERRS